MEKNDTQISGFAVLEKGPSPSKKHFLKKNSSSLFVTKWCAEIFLE